MFPMHVVKYNELGPWQGQDQDVFMSANPSKLGNRNTCAFTAADVNCIRIDPTESARRIGMIGNNPTQVTMLITMINEEDARVIGFVPPTVIDVRSGKWDKQVFAGGDWDSDMTGVVYYACFLTPVTATTYTREVLLDA